MEFTSLENALNPGIFSHTPPPPPLPLPTQNSPKFLSSPPSPGRGELFIPPGSIFLKRVEGTMICSTKIQSENMKITRNIRLFTFCMNCNFFKCDSFTVLQIISFILYVINFIVSPCLLCNHDELILKLHQK